MSKNKTKLNLFAFLDTHPFVIETVIDIKHRCTIASILDDTTGLYTEFLTKV
jgi:hypothetical protein